MALRARVRSLTRAPKLRRDELALAAAVWLLLPTPQG
jgi:hypothetical protein